MRGFTLAQQQLLRSPSCRMRCLVTFELDEGTYRFCDDVVDWSDGTNTYVGANALTESVELKSSENLAAEPVTLEIDGNRMAQYGVADPAAVLRDMLTYMHQQRRVDINIGFGYVDQRELQLILPAFAGKINYARLTDEKLELLDGQPTNSKLQIVLDSLAMRYQRATYRVRNHQDQLEIDPTDNFFSFVNDAIQNERTLYWGKAAPFPKTSGGTGGGSIPRPDRRYEQLR